MGQQLFFLLLGNQDKAGSMKRNPVENEPARFPNSWGS
jgi:hypothetical protein